ncbi:hypothetical protein UA08_03965 [Talaromyces atroroseus]|uniref:Phospholipid/glycerol acyltransferase domain-containing protein n=1 Tax=Talaromyces atroroseus TaxID=1441469 RepID=A0A1Q5Q982_TALAT|nr:hypothetical protein UA08_03965 [Talaromyces atroroseus]OKL60687.1 hypothetical protein UA08_03965 [Talaromyces atroroseus]
MGYKANTSSSRHHALLAGMLSVLILLLTVDIYLSVLSPRSCSFFSMASQKIVTGYGFDNDNEQEGQQRIDGMTIEELLDIQHHDNRRGILFHEINELEDLNHEGDEAWDKLFPPSGGYLFLTSNETTSSSEPWGIGMFHGLHCLQMLWDTIRDLEGQLNQSDREQRHNQRHEHSHEGAGAFVNASTHYKHCFAYLAQSIACAADGTLEAPHFHYYQNGTFKNYNVDGVGTWHQCRDLSLIWKKVLESEERPLEQWDHQVGDTVQSFRDRVVIHDLPGSGIAPFLPIPTPRSGYALPLHVFLFCFRLPLLIFVCLSYFVVLQWLPIGSLGKKASLWCILGVPSLWWIDLQVDGVKRGRLASQRSRLPVANCIIASSFTSPIDPVYLAAIFDPVFTASYPNTRKVERLSLLQAILRSFAYPYVTPPPNARLVDLSDLIQKYRSRPVVVFAECTTTNGRGILPLSKSLVSVPPRTKIYPVSLRYTEADVTTPVPGSYLTFLWNLLSKPTHFIRVRVAEYVTTKSLSPSSRSHSNTSTDFFDEDEDQEPASFLVENVDKNKTSDLTRHEIDVLDYVGESLARLGRVKRVGLGVKEKQDFVNMWARQQRLR